MVENFNEKQPEKVDPTKVDGAATEQKNLANDSGAWKGGSQTTDTSKPADANKTPEKTEPQASTSEHSGLSLIGLLKEAKAETVNLWDKWTKVDDKTFTDKQGNTLKVVSPESQLFTKYEFDGGNKTLDLATPTGDQNAKVASADKPKDQAATGSYLDMHSGTVVKPETGKAEAQAPAADKANTSTPEAGKDQPSPKGLAWLKEVTTFFGFGDKGAGDKPDATDSTKKAPVESHEFTDKSGHPVKVEVGDGQALHSSDGVTTVKNADGVTRTDKTATTEWSPGKVDVVSADKKVEFHQDGQKSQLDFNQYTVTKLPGDKFQFTDKKTGESVEFEGDEVRKHIGKTILLAVKDKDLDKAVDQERKSTKGDSDHLIAATDGKGNTLIKQPDGVRILIKDGKSATATYPDGTQISAEMDGTRKIKDKDGHITVLKPGEDAPKNLKLPAGVGFDENGQLSLVKSGVTIDKEGHLHGLHGLNVDMKKSQIDLEDETTHKYSHLINKNGATTLNSPDGGVLKTDGAGHTSVTTAGGETVKYDAEKRELSTSKGTFSPDHVTLWNGETVYKDTSVRFSNGDIIARDGSATFADGTRFAANGNVSTSDGWHTHVTYGHSIDLPHRKADSGFVQKAINIYTGAEVSSAGLYKNDITEADIASAEANLGNLDSLIALLSRKGAVGPASQLAGLRGELMGAINDAKSRLGQKPKDGSDSQKDQGQIKDIPANRK